MRLVVIFNWQFDLNSLLPGGTTVRRWDKLLRNRWQYRTTSCRGVLYYRVDKILVATASPFDVDHSIPILWRSTQILILVYFIDLIRSCVRICVKWIAMLSDAANFLLLMNFFRLVSTHTFYLHLHANDNFIILYVIVKILSIWPISILLLFRMLLLPHFELFLVSVKCLRFLCCVWRLLVFWRAYDCSYSIIASLKLGLTQTT